MKPITVSVLKQMLDLIDDADNTQVYVSTHDPDSDEMPNIWPLEGVECRYKVMPGDQSTHTFAYLFGEA